MNAGFAQLRKIPKFPLVVCLWWQILFCQPKWPKLNLILWVFASRHLKFEAFWYLGWIRRRVWASDEFPWL
jgi:hypothetical protein